MSDRVVYLKWDGICLDNIEDASAGTLAPFWCNTLHVPDGTKPPPETSTAAVSTDPNATTGTAVQAQSADITLIQVSDYFAPIEEYLLIEARIKNIQEAGCLVLQIHDGDKKLVYAERLTQAKIWGLPTSEADADATRPQFAYAKNEDVAEIKKKREARRKAKWATLFGSPYTITLWITNKVCADKTTSDALSLKVAAPGTGFSKNNVQALASSSTTPSTRKIGVDQTALRLNSLKLERMDWAHAYRNITVNSDTDTPPTTDDELLLWVKYKLNEIGFHAGPLNNDAVQPDFQKALMRYRLMRRIGGAVYYGWDANTLEYTALESSRAAALKTLNGRPDLDTLVPFLQKEKKAEPFDTPDAFATAGSDVKCYLDNNRFYADTPGEFVHDNHDAQTKKNALEDQWLSRPAIPLRAHILLEGRKGKGEGIEKDGRSVAEAVRTLGVTWSWKDFPEVLTTLPSPTNTSGTSAAAAEYEYTPQGITAYNTPANCSQTQGYIQRAKQDTRASTNYNNANANVGGLLTANDADNAASIFRTYPAFQEIAVGDRHATAPPVSGYVVAEGMYLYFCPSRIAGDTYELTAEINFDHQRVSPGNPYASDKITNWKDWHTKQLVEKSPGEHRLRARTAKLTVWRRIRIAAFLTWPATPQNWRGANMDYDAVWRLVCKEYAHAFVEVSANPNRMPIENLEFPTGTRFQTHFDRTANPGPAGLMALARGLDQGLFQAIRTNNNTPPDNTNLRGLTFTLQRICEGSVATPAVAVPAFPLIINEVVKEFGAACKKLYGTNPTMANTARPYVTALRWLCAQWAAYPTGGSAMQTMVRDAGIALTEVFTKTLESDTNGNAVKKAAYAAFTDCHTAYALAPNANVAMQATTGVLTYTPNPVPTYTAAEFADLMDMIFLPPAVITELNDWVNGTVPNPVPAPLCNNIRLVASQMRPADPLAKEAAEHFEGWFRKVIVTKDKQFNPAWDTGNRREILRCPSDPIQAARDQVNGLVVNGLTGMFNLLSKNFDEIIRGGLRQQLDTGGKYAAFGDGMHVLHVKLHETMTIGGTPYVPPGASFGAAGGLAICSQGTFMEPYALIAHEMAHTLFFKHWRGGGAGAGVFDHDHDDLNCMMTYPILSLPEVVDSTTLTTGQQRVLQSQKALMRQAWATRDSGQAKIGQFDEHQYGKNFRPHFCGKCNLQLRGWNIRHSTVPISGSGNSLPATAPF